jgi:hypothetical protein
MESTDLIRTLGSFPNLQPSNAGRFLHRGGDATLWPRPLARLGLYRSYGYLDPGELTQAKPRHQLHGAVHRRTGRMLTVGVQLGGR